MLPPTVGRSTICGAEPELVKVLAENDSLDAIAIKFLLVFGHDLQAARRRGARVPCSPSLSVQSRSTASVAGNGLVQDSLVGGLDQFVDQFAAGPYRILRPRDRVGGAKAEEQVALAGSGVTNEAGRFIGADPSAARRWERVFVRDGEQHISIMTFRYVWGVLLVVTGDLDIATVATFDRQVRAVLGSHHINRLDFDLSGVEFCDLAGVRALQGLSQNTATARIIAAGACLDVLLGLCRLDTLLGTPQRRDGPRTPRLVRSKARVQDSQRPGPWVGRPAA